MIEIRELEKSEYARLAQVSEGCIPNPETSSVIIAEQDGKIVGRMFLVCMPYIEGTWISPDARNGTCGMRLLHGMEAKVRSLGVKMLLAYAPDAHIEDYLSRIGFQRKPVTVWGKEI